MAETTFIRASKERDFTMMSNVFLRDDTLSAQAKGVFAYLLFLPNDWVIYQSELCKHFSNGKDSLRSIINELEEHGYITKEKVKGEKGRFGGYNYIINEVPCLDNRDGKSAAENPKSENPPLPNTNNNQVLNKPSTDKPTKSEKKSFSKSDYDDCIQIIGENKVSLISQNKNIDSTQYAIPVMRKWIKKVFELYGVEDVKKGLKNSVHNYWLINSAHYSMTALFSEKMFPKYIANEGNGAPVTASSNKGSAISQLGGYDANSFEEFKF